tara:strand:- start:400 stop:759 length:360 start_codon:yes stop_codon:yes gene_type:complete
MIKKVISRSKRAAKNRFSLKKKSKSNFRLSVFRSNKHIYAQIIDDMNHETLFFASSIQKTLSLKKGSDKQAAFKVGEHIAEEAIKKGFKEKISFDRGGYLYHGRVKQVADGARSKGLKL